MAEKHERGSITMSYTVGDSVKAFDDAIAAGHISTNQNSARFAGNYMYMHTDTASGADSFKHIITRQYLKVPAKN